MALAPVVQSRIASFDGTPIGIQVSGPEDAPLLLLANGAGARMSSYAPIMKRFAGAFRFVSWDYRGTHSSGRPVRGYKSLDVADHARDALAVVDAVAAASPGAAGGTTFHALGWSMGVQVLLEAHRFAAERFETLVLHNGVPGKTWDTLGGAMLKQGALRRVVDPFMRAAQRADGVVERVIARAVDWPGMVPLAIRAGFFHHDVDRASITAVAREYKGVDMHIFVEILRRLGRHDASDVLAKVRCPTLVLQGTEDKLTPLSVAQRMAKEIDGAQLVLLPGGTHHVAFEMPELMNEHLAAFWRIAGIDVDTPAQRESA